MNLQGLIKCVISPCSHLLNGQHAIISNCLRAMIHNSAPLSGINKFKLMGIDTSRYTMKKLPQLRTGGRGPDGRVQSARIGGGNRRCYRMVDFKRLPPEDGGVLKERVLDIIKDSNKTGHIAVVASGESKRYILASENMKVGDVVQTSGEIPRVPVRAQESNTYPVGALPIGTMIHNIEIRHGNGGQIARAAGSSGQLVRKLGDSVVVRMPSKREVCISEQCMATVGRVSNVDQNKKKIGSANKSRWLGIRPSSGLKHKKAGYHGRKIRPIKPMVTISKAPKTDVTDYKFDSS